MSSISHIITGFPLQITDGIRAAETALRETRMPKISRRTSHVIFCGMGGSALPGLIVRDLFTYDPSLQKLHPHPVVHRNYGLPEAALHRPALVIVTSYSGNTEEALSSYADARRRRLPLFAVASGGTLAKWAERDRVPLARIPATIPQPRFAVGMQMSAIIALLAMSNILPRRFIKELATTAAMLRPEQLSAPARTLAKKLSDRIPLIYSSKKNQTLGYILKIQINENAKIPAFTNVLPELNHNEFNMYALLSPLQRALHRNLAVIFLDDSTDTREIRKRMNITSRFIRKSGAVVHRIDLRGKTLLLRACNAILVGEWLAVALAEHYRVEPLPIDLIEQFKKALRK